DEGALEVRMVVARLDALGSRAVAAPAQRDQGHTRLEEVGQREASGLELRVRELDAEADAQAVAAGGVERRGPHGSEVEAARPALHVAPVAADVEDVDEGERG